MNGFKTSLESLVVGHTPPRKKSKTRQKTRLEILFYIPKTGERKKIREARGLIGRGYAVTPNPGLPLNHQSHRHSGTPAVLNDGTQERIH